MIFYNNKMIYKDVIILWASFKEIIIFENVIWYDIIIKLNSYQNLKIMDG